MLLRVNANAADMQLTMLFFYLWVHNATLVADHVAMGNHESYQNYAHYTERFRHMPANGTGTVVTENGLAPNNWWYSWDAGLVHYVSVSTEIYFHPERLAGGAERQYEWLQTDLAAANRNRKAVPWIVVFGHRCALSLCLDHSSNEGRRTGLVMDAAIFLASSSIRVSTRCITLKIAMIFLLQTVVQRQMSKWRLLAQCRRATGQRRLCQMLR